jgi:hypothetical protein
VKDAGLCGFEPNADALNEQGSFDIVIVVLAEMFDALFPVVSKVVESDRILLLVDFRQDAFFEFDVLRRFDFALKDRVLDALTVVEANFGDVAQAAGTGRGAGGNIVGDEEIHLEI